MRHTTTFDNFLKNAVNLSPFRLETLEGRTKSIYTALKADADLGPRIIQMIPQGSWAQRTIISPQNGKPFDADFLLQIEEEPDWAYDPKKYAAAVYSALDDHPTYRKMPHSKKCRCVYVEYAENAMHVDIVPFVMRADGSQNIINRDANCWEHTDPAGFTDWMRDRDKIANGHLRKVIRLLKFLRDHKDSFTGTRSILITTLFGERVSQLKKFTTAGYYSDLPTSLLHLVADLDEWLQEHRDKPSIADPSGSGVTFDHRWGEETYSYFRDRIHTHAAEIADAYHETDETRSLAKWQALFGEKFQAPEPTARSTRFTAVRAAGTAGVYPTASSGRSGRAG